MVGRMHVANLGSLFLREHTRKCISWASWNVCKFSTKSTDVDTLSVIQANTPLSEPLPGLPPPLYASLKEEHHTTQVTTLSNGLKVASENRFGQFCTVGGTLWNVSRKFHSVIYKKYPTSECIVFGMDSIEPSCVVTRKEYCRKQPSHLDAFYLQRVHMWEKNTFVIDSGPRYEVAYPSGISHFLEKLAFNSTTEYSDKDKILYELEKHGGICDCQSSRDTFVYAASADSRGLDPVIKVLGEIVLRPQISVAEMDMARQAIRFELETLLMRPEQEHILMDMIHAAAYRDNTLGLPKICPEENTEKITRNMLFTFLKHHYTPKRMVIAGVGVEHAALVECVQKYFVEQNPIWEEDSGLIIPGSTFSVDESIAQYTGGIVQEVCEIPLFAGPSGLPELAHVVLALEGCSHQDPDFIPICVLNMMMGGGGSFSAGGPGKGMYTRLYTNVLNRYHWMYNATAYNHAYGDTGLFCIHASAPPSHVRDMVEVIVREMVNMAGKTGDVELQRAKTQLQSMLLMNLEARPVVFEDIGRQVLATGQRKRPEFFINAIEKVTPDDIERVAKRLLRSQPSLAARGEVNKLPTLIDVQSGLQNEEGRMPGGRGRLSLFR